MIDVNEKQKARTDSARADSIAQMNAAVIGERLARIEEALSTLVQQRSVQRFYSTSDIARMLGKAEFTVREWCRHQRIRAEKRPCGRGSSKEWMISHEELERIRAEGLLSAKYGQ